MIGVLFCAGHQLGPDGFSGGQCGSHLSFTFPQTSPGLDWGNHFGKQTLIFSLTFDCPELVLVNHVDRHFMIVRTEHGVSHSHLPVGASEAVFRRRRAVLRMPGPRSAIWSAFAQRIAAFKGVHHTCRNVVSSQLFLRLSRACLGKWSLCAKKTRPHRGIARRQCWARLAHRGGEALYKTNAGFHFECSVALVPSLSWQTIVCFQKERVEG